MALKRFASIDVGSFEIELGIYELGAGGGIRLVDNLRHVIALGSDSYRDGEISFPLVQELIAVLKDFTRVIAEYRCTAYRAIATSALREAANSAIVLDQIKTRTGLDVQILSNTEQRMLVLKALAACGERFETLVQEGAAVVEVGFGSMQVSLYEAGKMRSTQNLRLGALRLRDTLQQLNSARDDRECILQETVAHELEIYENLHLLGRKVKHMIAIGDPIRVLYDKIMRARNKDPEAENFADRERVEELYRYVVERTDAELEETLDINPAATGVLLPAAVLYQRMAETVGAERVWFPGTRLIDGLAAEYAVANSLMRRTHDFDADILAAVQEIAARYGEGTVHRAYTVKTALQIFDALKKAQGFTARDRILLEIGATLHHCGRYLNMGNASGSSADIIRATEIVGLSKAEHALIVQILRNEEEVFERRELPLKAAKFAAVIRLASALDRSAKQKAGEYRVRLKEDGTLLFTTAYGGDMTLSASASSSVPPRSAMYSAFVRSFGREEALGAALYEKDNEKKNKKQDKKATEKQDKKAEKLGTAETLDLSNPAYYVCRELSWLQFNLRVLNEARDKNIPLFERLKFLSIVSSNLDEFFMVRVASLKEQVLADFTRRDIAGLTAAEQLKKISEETHEMVSLQYRSLKRSLIPALEKEGLHLISSHEELSEKERNFVDRYFKDTIYPVLTPMAVDSSRPFPLIRNKTLNIAALIRKKEHVKPLIRIEEKKKKGGLRPDFAIVQVPSVLPRLVELPPEVTGRPAEEKSFILLEEIIERNISSLFLNYDILAAHPFRIMRNAEFELDEEEAADLLVEIQKKLKRRQWGEAIRLEVEEGMDEELLQILESELEIEPDDLFLINGPLDLTVLMKLYGVSGFERLKLPKHTPQPVPALVNEKSIFANIREGDILLSHPYQSFDPVVNFIQEAAKDPDVLAIKQTLYRVSGNSPIVQALAKAADNGKQVTVLVELKARFDEENNIVWAKMLEKAGCHVIYGLLGLKTHSKITLVVRSEEDGIRRYVHLGTGNYNDSTAKLYTDLGLLTCRREFGEDATAVFNMLSGYSEPLFWNRLVVAPLWMRDKFVREIEKVRAAARAGKPAFITAKMNSLSDPGMIRELYRASMDGVQIDLIIRGICCLRVGIPGVSENIRVRSIVGNFLEHARIFRFHADGEESLYLGSADWMTRNLDNRVEIVFPIVDSEIRAEVQHYLDIELRDNVKASIYCPDGSYEKEDRRGRVALNSQEVFAEEAIKAAAAAQLAEKRRGQQEERGFTPLL